MCSFVLGDLKGVEQVPEMHHFDTVVHGQLQAGPHAGVDSRVLDNVKKRHQIQQFGIQIVSHWQNVVGLAEEGI